VARQEAWRRPHLADVASHRTSRPGRIAIALAFGIGGAVALAAAGWSKISTQSHAAHQPHPAWAETPWPFPMDEWGKGKAYRCTAVDCGTEVHIYLRAKIGFCNCATGVAHDEDLERLSDLTLLGGQAAPLGGGRPIAVGWMRGRARPYQIGSATAVSTAFHHECDALVATAAYNRAPHADIDRAVLGFLSSPTVLDWATVELGL
jgi:hypothetical protein